MKISFITTVFNEEKSIIRFLNSLLLQTTLPDEIIIVDGGSYDNTVAKIKKFSKKLRIIVKQGNRSIGRNEAIKHAKGNIILCSDAGNVLDKKWIENIIAPFADKNVDVVAGYYKGIAKNVFQKCLIPFVLVMPDKVNPYDFLPATRSIAFKKSIWKKIGGFDKRFSHNEDYIFAKKLKKFKAKIIFSEKALVYWIPRDSYFEAFIMFFRFALGDAEARILRKKVIFVFFRYILGVISLFASIINGFLFGILFCTLLLFLYIVWAICKNYKYVNNLQGFIILPLLQFTADMAVLSGTLIGFTRRYK